MHVLFTDGTCQEQELKNVKIIFGYPSVTSPYLSGHVLVFLCTDENMKMYGPRAIECQSDGRWSKPYPQCGGKALGLYSIVYNLSIN